MLAPFSLIYKFITGIRNYLYDRGVLKSVRFNIPVISVGNLSVGGTGKTPHTEYLIDLLKDRYAVAVLSRGYGRKTKGFILADDTRADADTLGDEPAQYYRKYGREIAVAVGERRMTAIPELLAMRPETEVILLDDAFQHRSVSVSFNIVLTTFQKPFFSDFLLPGGRLRESRRGALRADAVVVTKCPADLSSEQKNFIRNKILKYIKAETPVFFSNFEYDEPVPIGEYQREFSGNILFFSGIADDRPIRGYLEKRYELLDSLRFPDHHRYTVSDLEKIMRRFQNVPGNAKSLLTTEKDMVKLFLPEFQDVLKMYSIFYIPVKARFLSDESQFEAMVNRAVHDR